MSLEQARADVDSAKKGLSKVSKILAARMTEAHEAGDRETVDWLHTLINAQLLVVFGVTGAQHELREENL